MRAFFSGIARRLLAVESAGWLLAIGAAWLLATAGLRPLLLPDEGRYVGVAWEMLRSGDWLVPTLDGLPFFHKPPLFYWLTAFGMQLFGLNEWAARLASTASAALAMAAVFVFIRKYAGKQTANLSLAVLVTQPFFFAGAQYANLDMLVASMITLTIVAGADAILRLESGQPYRKALAAAYAFAALGVLAKGLIGFVLPGAILLAWIILRRQFRLIPALLSPPFVLLFFALAAPWFVAMQESFSGFWDYFFIYHHFRRFAETGFNNQEPFWFYIPVLLACTLPWSPWIFRAGARGFWKDREQFALRSLMALWTLGIVVFFSLPKSKLIGYILPALPPFACLIADLILCWQRDRRMPEAPARVGASFVAACILCLGVVIGVSRHDPSRLQHVAEITAAGFRPGDQIVMLQEYEFDMPFYLRMEKDAWVVSDWGNPVIPKIDDWRKELHDAGQFAPDRMQQNLITPDELGRRLCQLDSGTYWFWGKQDVIGGYPFLNVGTIVFSNARRALWRVDIPSAKALMSCGGKPSNG